MKSHVKSLAKKSTSSSSLVKWLSLSSGGSFSSKADLGLASPSRRSFSSASDPSQTREERALSILRQIQQENDRHLKRLSQDDQSFNPDNQNLISEIADEKKDNDEKDSTPDYRHPLYGFLIASILIEAFYKALDNEKKAEEGRDTVTESDDEEDLDREILLTWEEKRKAMNVLLEGVLRTILILDRKPPLPPSAANSNEPALRERYHLQRHLSENAVPTQVNLVLAEYAIRLRRDIANIFIQQHRVADNLAVHVAYEKLIQDAFLATNIDLRREINGLRLLIKEMKADCVSDHDAQQEAIKKREIELSEKRFHYATNKMGATIFHGFYAFVQHSLLQYSKEVLSNSLLQNDPFEVDRLAYQMATEEGLLEAQRLSPGLFKDHEVNKQRIEEDKKKNTRRSSCSIL